MKQLILILAMVLTSNLIMAQGKNVEKLTVQSSIQCEMCIDRLNDMFAEYRAVKGVEYDLEKQLIAVTYKHKKTTADDIRKSITKVGYDADEQMADIEAYLELPDCCKKQSKCASEKKM